MHEENWLERQSRSAEDYLLSLPREILSPTAQHFRDKAMIDRAFEDVEVGFDETE